MAVHRIRMLVSAVLLVALAGAARGDETCMSPYMAKVVGQEDFVYVWTLGVDGLGDGSDKLVTIDVSPKSGRYGKVVATLAVGGRHEAHHSGLTDDRRFLWAAGLDTSEIFVFDVATDPAKPALARRITDFVSKSGGVLGPHTLYALPGRMLITGLSNAEDKGGRTGMVEYTNDGAYVTTHWMPTDADLRGSRKGIHADGYGYDVRALPRLNALFTSSFTGWNNYMRGLGDLLGDAEAMKHFGNTMVVWNLHARKPVQVLDVPGAPLEIRCAWGGTHDYCFTSTALTSQLWRVAPDAAGRWQAKAVADIGDPKQTPLPVDISISADDTRLWVDTFMDGKARLFDISNPEKPKQIYEKVIGKQLNMVSQSWDGQRVYFTSSLLANWDKSGADGEQFIRGFAWDGKQLVQKFAVDFTQQKLGRPHQMRFGAYALYGLERPDAASGLAAR